MVGWLIDVPTRILPLIHINNPTTMEHLPNQKNRQDPTECLFSFICSSNNNIPRITLMLDRLRAAYGEPLVRPVARNALGWMIECVYVYVCSRAGSDDPGRNALNQPQPNHTYIYTSYPPTQADGFHAFPSIDALAAAPEQALRDLGA